MKQLDIHIPVKALSYSELTAADANLVRQAQKATERSYAPYSHFRVGAAIELEGDIIVTGSNQENAAYPSGTCAERTACYWAGAQHPGVPFRAIAIAAVGTDGEPVAEPIAPCGACRQALLEYEKLSGAPVRVLLCGRDEVYEFPSVASLLPLAFVEF